MIKKLFSSVFVLFVFFSLAPSKANAEFPVNNWPYYKDIQTDNTAGEVAVKLDDELLTQVQDLLRDVRVVDNNSGEIPYSIKGEISRNKAIQGDITEVLVNGQAVDLNTLNLSLLKDDDKKSYTKFESTAGEPLDISIVFDLKEKTVLDKLVVFSYIEAASYNSVEVLGSNDGKEYKAIRPRISDEYAVWRWYSFIRNSGYQYYRLNLQGGSKIILNEVMLLTPNQGTINFASKEGDNYRLFYGYGKASLPEYGDVKTEGAVISATLATQSRNGNFIQDSDKDGVPYRNDNCPEVSNPKQEDTNDNGIGDLCENQENKPAEVVDTTNEASKVGEEITTNENELEEKQIAQTDINDRDSDSVNNIFDNCPDIANPNQVDSDKDGIGDVCDRNSKEEVYSQILVGVLIFVCVIIIFSILKISFSAAKRAKKNELPIVEKGKDQIFSDNPPKKIIKKQVPRTKSVTKVSNSKVKKGK